MTLLFFVLARRDSVFLEHELPPIGQKFPLIVLLDDVLGAAPPSCPTSPPAPHRLSTLQSQCFFLGIVVIVKLLKSKPLFYQITIIHCDLCSY